MWNVFAPDTRSRVHQREAVLLTLAFVFLCLFGLGLTLSAAARVQDWKLVPGMLRQLLFLPVWGAGAWLLHREADRTAPGRDPYLLPIAMLLTGWGVLTIWRLNPAFGLRQILWFVIACLLVIGLFRIDPRLRWLREYRYLWMSLAIALLGLTLFFGTNPLGAEPRLWLGCCGVYLQPSEPLRFFLVAFLASYLGDRLRLNDTFQGRLPWRDLLPLLLVWGTSVILLVVQRDLGTGMIFLALLALLLYLATGSWQVLVLSGVVAVGGGILSFYLFDVVQVRVQAWLNPWLDPSGSSYQIVQSLISIASGGIVGRGPGLGSPGFVPATHTDFIFTAITEEFGLLGAVVLIALFAVFVSRGLRIGLRHEDKFARFLSAGLTLTIGLQAIFIIGGVMRALPLVGITLPFVSYGGSSLLTSYAALAILVLFSQTEELGGRASRAFESLQFAFSFAWFALALIAGWWTIYRAPTLVARTDNPRRSLDSRFVERGMITDRNGVVLARSSGSPGSYERDYPHRAAAPVIGFDSMIYGQAGIESSMDPILRGLESGTPLENAWQRLISGHPPPGEHIELTIDIELQTLAMDLLDGKNGALVLLEANSGELYALASQPSFDPNRIEETWQELVADADAPLVNRVTQALYQPGLSVAPFFFAQANALDTLQPDTIVSGLTETVDVNGEVLTCSLAPPHSIEQSLASALHYGCPGPMQRAFTSAGWDSMKTAIDSFGFTQPVGIPLEEAEIGELPDDLPAEQLAQYAIGQGSLRVSPLRLGRAFGGLLADPERGPLRLVRAIDVRGEGRVPFEPVGYRVPPFSEAVVSTIKAIYASGGTDRFDLRAQAISGSEGELLGWYLGALERADRLWVVIVVLENEQPYIAEGLGRVVLDAADQSSP